MRHWWPDDDLPEGIQKKVTLMTAHLSKGLEFPIVYVVGMNEGSFPHSMSTLQSEIEEERRLIYVAFTRAKERLFLARFRLQTFRRGPSQTPEPAEPSRFIKEIPKDAIKMPKHQFSSETPHQRKDRLGFSSKPFPRAIKRRATAKASARAANSRTPSFLNSGPRTSRIEPENPLPSSESTRTREPESLDDFQPGVSVLHSRYGIGEILNRSGYQSQLKLSVRFQNGQVKKLMASHSNLEIVIK